MGLGLAILIAVGLGAALRSALLRLQATRKQLEATRSELASVRESQAEDTAQEQARQRTIFNSMVEGVLLLDAAGRIQFANDAITRIFRLTASAQGKTVLEAFRMHELQALVNGLQQGETARAGEFELPGLEDRSLSVNASAFHDDDGDCQGMILIFHDLTHLKRLENTRQEFVANVSHELRTPLSLIKGYVETLIDGAKDDPEVSLKFLRTIDRHADRLTFLIEDLLTISRLESGQVVLNLQPLELAGLVSSLLAELPPTAKDKQVALHQEIPAGLLVNADRDRLEQVITNLVENAIKYGRQTVAVTIGAKPGENQQVEVWIKDDGPGIAKEHLDRIFERFYRVDRARSREQGGTGLGLSIVKHIVHSHGGRVWAESEPGRGSIFHLTLPCGSEPAGSDA